MYAKTLWRIAVVAMLLLGAFGLSGAHTAYAQEPTTTVTIFDSTFTGDSDTMANAMLSKVRPTLAKMEPSVLYDTTEYSTTALSSCFGVIENRQGGNMLLETIYETQRDANGRYNAVTPADGVGDWPPHLVLFDVQTDRALACNEFVAEISYRLRLQPASDLQLTYSFELDEATLAKEYDVMASGGQLGLFVASQTPVTVNGERLAGSACHDCPAHTMALTGTIGSGIYTAKDVAWFGDMASEPVPALAQMYVLPVPKVAGQQWHVTIEAGSGDIVWIWFGRFDFPTKG